VYAWVDATGAGYRKTARHFGLPPGKVRWALDQREKEAAAELERAALGLPAPDRSVADMDRGEFLRWMIDCSISDIGAMRENGSYQALTSEKRQLRQLREEFEAWQRQNDEDFDGGDPEAVAEEVIELMGIPDVRAIVLAALDG
jgi:hypothetical protein